MSRIWEDAANILETASAPGQSESSDFAILIDRQNGLRMVDAAGWQLEALRREYQAAAAYAVKRTPKMVVVEAQDGPNRCVLTRSIGGQLPFVPSYGWPQHLIRPEQALLA